MYTSTAAAKRRSSVHCSQALLKLQRSLFFPSKMRFVTFIWDVLMTFLSTVSVLVSSIGWLMSQLANVMFFLLQLLIISMTFCPSEPLQKLCTAEERTLFAFRANAARKIRFGNILYRARWESRDAYDARCCLLWNSLQHRRKAI